MDRDEVTDEELVAATRAGDDRALDALLLRYHAMVRAATAPYFLVGAERDDLVQEGLIGLLRAVRDFDAGRRVTFRTFANLCVSRQVLTAVRAATRHKHEPLNDYVPIHGPLLVDDGECTLADMLPATPEADPAEFVLLLERVRDLGRHARAVLSDLESEVLALYVGGRSPQEIAGILERRSRSVDNALQRARRKMSIGQSSRAAPVCRTAAEIRSRKPASMPGRSARGKHRTSEDSSSAA